MKVGRWRLFGGETEMWEVGGVDCLVKRLQQVAELLAIVLAIDC